VLLKLRHPRSERFVPHFRGDNFKTKFELDNNYFWEGVQILKQREVYRLVDYRPMKRFHPRKQKLLNIDGPTKDWEEGLHKLRNYFKKLSPTIEICDLKLRMWSEFNRDLKPVREFEIIAHQRNNIEYYLLDDRQKEEEEEHDDESRHCAKCRWLCATSRPPHRLNKSVILFSCRNTFTNLTYKSLETM
jgi:hypothetical protein